MMMSPFPHLILFLLFSPLFAQAAIKIQSISGVSNWSKEGNTVIVYGGFAGSESSGCPPNSDGTCNNCQLGSGLLACNEKRAMLASEIQITLSSDSAARSGPIILTTSDGNTKIGSNGNTVGKNEIGTFAITWSTLCGAVFSSTAGSSCVNSSKPSNSVSLKIGVDEDGNSTLSTTEGDTISFKVFAPTNADTIEHCSHTGATFTDGVCAFTAYPGDQKVFIEDLEPTSTFPNSGEIQFSKARFYYSTMGFAYGANGANPGSNFGYKDIDIETENDEYYLSDKTISGLTNGDYYFFRIAMVDQANNISFITSDTAIQDACGGKPAASLGANPTDDLNCPFIARPDEVVGLLSKDLNCFIASATYGSALHPYLSTFREFRYKVLLQYDWGKSLVRSYYRWGPYAARWIQEHPFFRTAIQGLLWPLWLFSWLSLKYSFNLTLLGFFSLNFCCFLFALFLYQRKKRDV